MDVEDEVLSTLRQIIRATDIYSRKLNKTLGLTAPQLLVLQTIQRLGPMPLARLSSVVSLASPTVTTIVDRLEKRGFVRRERTSLDRRVVHTQLTEQGVAAIATAPTPLQDTFVKHFARLEDWEKSMILSSLQRVAALMKAEDLDAAPVLHVGQIDATAAGQSTVVGDDVSSP